MIASRRAAGGARIHALLPVLNSLRAYSSSLSYLTSMSIRSLSTTCVAPLGEWPWGESNMTKPNPKNEPKDQTRKRKVDALGGPTPEQMAARQENSAAAMWAALDYHFCHALLADRNGDLEGPCTILTPAEFMHTMRDYD